MGLRPQRGCIMGSDLGMRCQLDGSPIPSTEKNNFFF